MYYFGRVNDYFSEYILDWSQNWSGVSSERDAWMYGFRRVMGNITII